MQRRADGRLSKATEVAGGALRIPATLTRSGVFEYRRDGKPWREYRPLDEVMHADSLATLRAAPATDLHPREGAVVLATRRKLEVGHVADNVRADETDATHVAADIVITDPGVIDLVRRDQRAEISCGYSCKLDETPGETPDGERYDAVQRSIRYNHAALLPRGHGRAGGTVALRLDSSGNEITPPGVDGREDPMKTIRIDGVDYDPATEAFAQAWAKHEGRLDEAEKARATAEAERDTERARADAAEEKAKELEGELATAADPKRLDSVAAERAELIATARKIAGDDFRVDGLTADEIRRGVVEAKGVKLEKGRDSSVYIEARFDGFAEAADAAPSAVTRARAVVTVPRSDAAPATPAPRKVPDWQRSCTVSKGA